jgi:hypothetical protein
MSSALAELIQAEAGAIADELASELRRSNAPHYHRLGEGVLRRRCQELVQAFLESCVGRPGAFEAHVRRITEQRMSEGFYLDEMQQALTIVEQRAWQVAVQGSNVAQLVRHLSIVTGTIGRAKDELARAFCAGKQRAEGAIARLRLEGLFQGTEGHVEPAEGEYVAPQRKVS